MKNITGHQSPLKIYSGLPLGSCCCAFTQLCLTFCDPMACSMPGFPDLHHLLEFAQSHAHWVGDAIQPISSSVTSFSFCPQSFPASGSFPMSQLFPPGGQSIGASASASKRSFQWKFQGWFPLGSTFFFISLLSKGLSRVFSSTTVWRHQFFVYQSGTFVIFDELILIHHYCPKPIV